MRCRRRRHDHDRENPGPAHGSSMRVDPTGRQDGLRTGVVGPVLGQGVETPLGIYLNRSDFTTLSSRASWPTPCCF
jgi:hypothetical protein